MMILKEIYRQPQVSTLIEDSWQCKGRPLFLSLIHHYSELGYSIQYFKYDSPLSSEKTDMKNFNFSWQEKVANSNEDASMVLTASGWNSEHLSGNTIVAIDSLSPLLINWNVGIVASFLGNLLKSKRASVIALVHGDAHDREALKALNYIFCCHLTLQSTQGHNLCSGIWRKSSGKIIDSKEYYKITEQWELKDVSEATQLSCGPAISYANTIIPKSTFKLDLNAKEEEARSQVVLPYIRKQSDDKSSKGQIIYEAESLDWENEDPDDDLEI